MLKEILVDFNVRYTYFVLQEFVRELNLNITTCHTGNVRLSTRLLSSLYNFGTDRIENTAFKNFFIVE
jgi:hypothetical protein